MVSCLALALHLYPTRTEGQISRNLNIHGALVCWQCSYLFVLARRTGLLKGTCTGARRAPTSISWRAMRRTLRNDSSQAATPFLTTFKHFLLCDSCLSYLLLKNICNFQLLYSYYNYTFIGHYVFTKLANKIGLLQEQTLQNRPRLLHVRTLYRKTNRFLAPADFDILKIRGAANSGFGIRPNTEYSAQRWPNSAPLASKVMSHLYSQQ